MTSFRLAAFVIATLCPISGVLVRCLATGGETTLIVSDHPEDVNCLLRIFETPVRSMLSAELDEHGKHLCSSPVARSDGSHEVEGRAPAWGKRGISEMRAG